MASRRGAVQSQRDEWRAEFYANSRPSTRRVPPQPPLSMQFQVRIMGPDMWRRVLARCLGALNVEAHGLAFVWHGFRHGGASRAFLRGDDLSLILIRGRWAAESSGRHYIQSGRQLLLAQNMPAEVTDLARRIERAGLDSLVARDLRARLR